MGVSLAIHHYPFKLAHDSLWPPYKMEAFCLRHHPFTTSHFLERSMTYPARLQKTYWLPFVRTNITLWRGFTPRPSNGHVPSTPAYSHPSWARSPSHRPCAKPPCASPLARRRGCFWLPCSAPNWLHCWARKGSNRFGALLASFQKHQHTSSNSASMASSTNTVSRDLILLPHYLLPSNGH